MSFVQSVYRTHTCKELRLADVDKEVTLSGWMMRKRDHGGVVFVDLRDHYGVTQVVFGDELREAIQKTRVESVLRVRGKVRARGEGLTNSNLETGEIEVPCSELEVLSECAVLPFQIAEDDNAPENTRLQQRFLELRKEKLHKNVVLGQQVKEAIREQMLSAGFTEYNTPILTSSSPEGARDFVVPSRIHPGRFFALPQAPQQFKQLIMVAGFDRYFQIAPCFRDEDSRADRSPGEFYQLDIEMSFVEQADIFKVNEHVMDGLLGRFSDWERDKPPYRQIRYADSMAMYGNDKPDLRNPLLIENVSAVFKDSDFRVFKTVLEQGGNIQAIKVPLASIPSRKYFDDAVDFFSNLTGLGLAYISFDEELKVKGSLAKFMSEAEVASLIKALDIKSTTSVLVAAGEDKNILSALGRLRDKLGADFDKLEKNVWRTCWITDYPLYEKDDEGQIQFSHNPFSMPQGGLKDFEEKDPLDIYATQYDLVLNGNEIGSGAVRNHLPEVMYRAFGIVGYSREVVDQKFGGMIRAFQYGAPPHGGIAWGIERVVMLLAGENAIRDVILFPLAQTAEDLMMNAPSELSAEQLKEVHIKLDLPPEMEK
ncbi:aspartate--tRNA ligase [Oligoflexia bacterium]|nr:aspartate--tRNA ligase [Oligoflexia bacterium]